MKCPLSWGMLTNMLTDEVNKLALLGVFVLFQMDDISCRV